jgi:type I restriction enzyme M protein
MGRPRRTRRPAEEQLFLIKESTNPKEVFRRLRNYLAGQFVGATRDDTLLDELLKCLFCKLYIETREVPTAPPEMNAVERAKYVRGIFTRVRADFADIYDAKAEILLDPDAIDMVMRQADFSLIDSASDPIGDAFEVFVGSESRGRSGQFFTPRVVTDFLVEALEPKPGETIIDPACGAGGFLSSVARYFIAQGVEAEKLPKLASRTFFGIDKDDYLTKLARLHISLIAKCHPNIYCADSLAMRNGTKIMEPPLVPKEGFDIVLTNPPFGTRIVAAKPEVLRTFELARKWVVDKRTGRWAPSGVVQGQVPPQVLFVERCLSLLKDGGRLGIVIPESILSNKSYRHVAAYMLDRLDVQAVVGMPESLFKTSGKGGTHTKTCLVVARKASEQKGAAQNVFMAEAEWCGHDSRARSVPHNDIPQIAVNLKRFFHGQDFEPSTLGFGVPRQEVLSHVLCPRYYDPQVKTELQALQNTHDLIVLADLIKDRTLSITTGVELGKLAYGTGDIPFIRTSDLSNWELKADPKHGVDRSYFQAVKAKQDVQAGDVLMVKDGTYLIGTCAIVTEQDEDIIYQSHLYKIRVNKNKHGLDPYMLLAILSSSVVQRQIRAKQFTQDIIDSLGERIRELVLPIPKAKATRELIRDLVRSAVENRLKAKEQTRKARQAVEQLSPVS